MTGISVKPGEEATMQCTIFGFPQSSVIWQFTPCEKIDFDEQSCDESKTIKYTVSLTKCQF